SMDKGKRVYSMGNPWDLGMTIVEGTYSGLLERNLYEKIHFTGSLNAGMSGGPAVTSDGEVIGVNVASAGDQLSFLVPAKFVDELVAETMAEQFEKPELFLLMLRDQLLRHQETYLSSIVSQAWETTSLGPYAVPGKIAAFVKCWGSSGKRKKWLYETVTQSCSFEDGIFLSNSLSTGTLQFTHTYISSEHLNRFRFYSLYQSLFQDDLSDDMSTWFDDEEEVGSYRCVDDFVASEGPSLKVVFCVRGYKKLPGLYDSIVKVATVDSNHQGLQGEVTLTGVSFEKAQAFGRKFLNNVRVAP
ncbi:MAG: serine protease, partial [Nitrospirota bacterium]|nr:serine protease [Nitrospirota bacterium]